FKTILNLKSMNNNYFVILCLFLNLFSNAILKAQQKPAFVIKDKELLNKKANGFKGIWYMIQPTGNQYAYKYSGGLATYPANHRPFAVYSKEANKTFFCYGGTDDKNSTLLHNVSYYD